MAYLRYQPKPDTISCGSCPTGFTGDGKNCKDIDDCLNVTCKNGGSCIDGIKNFTCSCKIGYTGVWCETDIDDCVNVTCYNNGSCDDGVNSYSCLCQEGFTGKHCKTNIDDCVSHQCKNSGTCIDGINSYSCVCQAGFTGYYCAKDIDDCVFSSCANGATCVDGVNQYSCICQDGFTGKLCQNELPTTAAAISEGRTVLSSSKSSTDTTSSTKEENLTPETTTEAVEKEEYIFEIRVYKEWDDQLRDESSKKFKELSSLLKNEIWKVYSGVSELKEVKIVSMRPGSIVADFQLTFETKVSLEEALAPLKKETASGKLGSLEVDPNSLKPKITKQETNEEKQSSSNLPLIIGVSCGSFALLAVVTICLVFYCKRSPPSRSNSSAGGRMPSEEAFPEREKYELQPTNSKQDKLGWIEEKGVSNEGMD